MDEAALNRNIDAVRKRIAQAAKRAGRSSGDVRLIAVSKGVEAEALREALSAGLREFGESRIQAAKLKIASPGLISPESGAVWHLIGHLQRNKARTAVELFDVIQSVDSSELAEMLNRHAGEKGKRQRILVQVKLSGEESKYGVSEDRIMGSLGKICRMENLIVEGLMTIPPFFEDPELSRPYFRKLREIRKKAGSAGFDLKELSMGMSGDFEVAVEEGATMVRVGTAIFGERKREAI